MSTYRPKDWVILGDGGSGWPPNFTGTTVQIADIGDHLHGTLWSPSYDFYIYPNRKINSDQQIAQSHGGGHSSSIRRKATEQEIKAAGGSIHASNDIFDFILTL